MKKQIIIIHWGNIFPDQEAFCKTLENRTYNPFEEKKDRKYQITTQHNNEFDYIKPDMPNKHMAHYKARKIWFEKIFPYLNDKETILIWHSLGGLFLLKYLSENQFPKQIEQLHFVASLIDSQNMPKEEEFLGDFTFNHQNIKNITAQVNKVFIYHSKDDTVVPYSHAIRLKELLPQSKLILFEDRWHFKQENFPELLENILKW